MRAKGEVGSSWRPWRHDHEDGADNGLDSDGRGALRHPPDPVRTEHRGVAVREVLLLFLAILIGLYWFVMVPSGRNGRRRENPTGRDDEGGTPPGEPESSEGMPSP